MIMRLPTASKVIIVTEVKVVITVLTGPPSSPDKMTNKVIIRLVTANKVVARLSMTNKVVMRLALANTLVRLPTANKVT